MTIGRRRVSALPPISRRDFISHGQFRNMLKHTCAAARLAPRCVRERADSRKRERAHVLRPRCHAPAPSALARRLDNLEPQLSASQRSFIASILVRAARARVRDGTAHAAMRPQFARSFAATRVPNPAEQRKRRTSLVSLWSMLPHVVGAYRFVEAVQRAHWQLQLEEPCASAGACRRTRLRRARRACARSPGPPDRVPQGAR